MLTSDAWSEMCRVGLIGKRESQSFVTSHASCRHALAKRHSVRSPSKRTFLTIIPLFRAYRRECWRWLDGCCPSGVAESGVCRCKQWIWDNPLKKVEKHENVVWQLTERFFFATLTLSPNVSTHETIDCRDPRDEYWTEFGKRVGWRPPNDC